MAALVTPWFMKTKTSDLRKVNQVFEERLQKEVTILELKQRKSLMKIDDQINILRRDLKRIRTEVDLSTDLDEHGRKVDQDALRSRSTGDLLPRCSGHIYRPLTKSALFRHNKFVSALEVKKKVQMDAPIMEMIREKYGEGSEVRNLRLQLNQKVAPGGHMVKRKRKSKTRNCKQHTVLGVIIDLDADPLVTNNTDQGLFKERLPSRGDSARDRRFSIATPRKRTRDELPAINKNNNTVTKYKEV